MNKPVTIAPITAIYKITSPSGSVYVGQTRNLENRRNAYRWKAIKNQVHLYRSILAFGFNQHKLEVLQSFDSSVSQSELNDAELHWWRIVKSSGVKMLNIKQPGNQLKQSEETKIKIGNGNRGKKMPPMSEARKKQISKFMIGNKFRVGCKLSDAHKAAISKFGTGRIRSEEFKMKMSLARTGAGNPMFGRKLSEERKAQISLANKSRIMTPEMKSSMSEPSKKYWQQWRAKQLLKEFA